MAGVGWHHLPFAANSGVMEMAADARRAGDLAIADQCRLNVLWLNGCVGGERALEIEVEGLSLHAALQSLHRCVERRATLHADAYGPPHGRLDDAAFDLVTLYGRAPTQAEPTAIRRLLRPGGAALFAAQNRWWHGRRRAALRASSTMSLRSAQRIRAAGFGDVRAYWVEPSLAIPRNLIPASAERVREFEDWRAQDSGSSPARSSMLAAGLRWMMYPAVLFVATA